MPRPNDTTDRDLVRDLSLRDDWRDELQKLNVSDEDRRVLAVAIIRERTFHATRRSVQRMA